jgi:hypothetical protein
MGLILEILRTPTPVGVRPGQSRQYRRVPVTSGLHPIPDVAAPQQVARMSAAICGDQRK